MKNFREVLINIREGETWESHLCTITRRGKNIEINWKRGIPRTSYTFCDTTKYRLVKNEVSFAEAFAEYEEGKEIASATNGYRYKKINNKLHFHSLLFKGWTENHANSFDIELIKGKWYIND